nr:hypothetical protein [uncultured Campylobacter sp.]
MVLGIYGAGCGCGFVDERCRAVFGVKFDACSVRVFVQSAGVFAVKFYEPKSQSKICGFGSNLAARIFKFENIRNPRKFGVRILKFAG